MNRSHIVHGPTGCGKTRNAERIAAALGLSKVQDNWSPMDQVFEPFDTLYLTASEGPWPDQARHVLSFAEAMGRVPDAVVEPKSRYTHRNGVEYEVVMIANGESTSPKYPPTIVYRGVANGKVWARPACDWDRSMQLVERPASAKVEGTEQVSSTWLAQLRSEYRQFAEAVETLQAKLQSTLARVAELERALQTVVNAADHGSWPTTVMHGIEVAREVLAGPSAQTQPSPAPTLRAAIDVANGRFEVPVAKWGADLIGEEGWPKVVARLYRSNAKYFPPFAEVQKPLPPGDGTLTVDPLITLAHYDRDVGTLRAANAKLEKELAIARDAASKGDDARHAAGGMEMEIQELREKVAELQKELRSRWTYTSTQATNCAGCGEHKHTPLRVDWMGGYVCLTCIDEKLEELHDDPAQHSVPDGYRLIRLEHFAAIKAQLDPEQVDAYRGRNIYDEDKVYANWNACRSALDEIKDVFQQIDWDAENELAELLAAAPASSEES
ncbi:hypothetical protein AAEZ52_07530 [Pseudomonas aeruginosa]|uniref:hypothetical protein n=1 Tax=Pseudomonas aeruginosa TaxID=287 RepID=UPI0015CA210F|nr:hypothetical protein [Pseudomonas aeruginosa]MDS9504263.1 hypothetical protein [Pseudomonas aeruginosa]MDS9510981.1 hypothetical protein [Pseudomonas aeruginosa]MDS9530250.1 hypothetical protein [Pseudomonas aeruginosa]MDS9661542.1 hypothetical protein [Pseudomonas aeruginosa]MDS9670429.1 hypothetical protein [Pseudomonas aeruginosa]